MTPYEALRCTTSEAARFLGQSETWGTVTEGKRADLILTRGNLLVSVKALRDPDGVFLNGFHFTRADLDSLLNQQMALDTLARHFGEQSSWSGQLNPSGHLERAGGKL